MKNHLKNHLKAFLLSSVTFLVACGSGGNNGGGGGGLGGSGGAGGYGGGGTGGSTTPVGSGCTSPTLIFDNWNTAACSPLTDTSTFALTVPVFVTSLDLFVNTTVAGVTLQFSLVGPGGVAVDSGTLDKGSCDPYQSSWCQQSARLNRTLAAGTYSVKLPVQAICSNAGSSNIGFVHVMGCPATSSTDAGATVTPDAGTLSDTGIKADVPSTTPDGGGGLAPIDGNSDVAKDVAGSVSGAATFIMGSFGDSTKNEAAGLVMVTVAGGAAKVQALTELIPSGFNEKRIDYRKGRVVMIVEPAVVPASTPARGNIVAFDLATPKTRWFVPIPKSGKTGFHYTIDATRAQLLDDGRVVVTVVYQSDDIYEDYKPHMLAIWDPEKDTIDVQGVLDSFVLGQPEIKSCDCDAEFGTLASSVFAVSRDGKYAYFSPMSAGTDGSVHGGPAFLARWDLVARTNERIAYTTTGASPWAVTDDGSRVVVALDSKMKSFDPVAKTSIDTESSAGAINVGQVFGSTYIRSWRGCDPGAFGGVGLADTKGGPGLRILDAERLPSPYHGVDVMSQFSADGKSVYLMAAFDSCTNDATKFAILQVPIAADNTANAVKVAEMEAKYDTYIFVRVDP